MPAASWRWALFVVNILAWVWTSHRSESTTCELQARQARPDPAKYSYRDGTLTLVNTTLLFDSHRPRDTTLDALLSQAFRPAPWDTRLIPYYRRATGRFDKDKVTLFTWMTADRVGRLISLASSTAGPLSVVFHISPNDARATRELSLLDKLIANHPTVSERVDVHLISSDHALQQNTWRNMARAFALTDWVLLWDADFEPCTDFQQGLDEFRRTAPKAAVDKLDRGQAALIIPPFEWNDVKDERLRGVCPADMTELKRMYDETLLEAFRVENPILSHAHDYRRWFRSAGDQFYQVKDYEFGFEFYGIFKRDSRLWMDTRFDTTGYDRSSFAAQTWLNDWDIWVLPGQYTVHREHAWPILKPRDIGEEWVTWDSFRMSLCHASAHRLARKHVLHGPEGDRVLAMCQEAGLGHHLDYDIKRLLQLSQESTKQLT